MLIAIDFDDTLTADPELWRRFIEQAKAFGHRVICITARRETDDNVDEIEDWMVMHGTVLPVYFTSLQSKVQFAEDRGLKVDIWIDDNPRACANGV